MAVDLSWSDPTAAQGSGGLALVTGDTLTQTSWQKTVSNLYILAGGNQECGRLLYSSATALIFRPVNGAWVRIAGLLYNLSADVSATNTNCSIDGVTGQTLAVSTVYYVYLYLVGSTVTLDFSTTAYAISTTAGNYGTYIKTGVNTRTLVGMIRTNGSSQFVDSGTQRFVRSWFNDPGIGATNNFTATRTTTSTSYAEPNSEIRVEALVWTGEVIEVMWNGSTNSSAAIGAGDVFTSIGIDGTTAEDVFGYIRSTGDGNSIGTSFTHVKTGLAEGYHYFTMLGKVDTGTGRWPVDANSAGLRPTLKLRTRR